MMVECENQKRQDMITGIWPGLRYRRKADCFNLYATRQRFCDPRPVFNLSSLSFSGTTTPVTFSRLAPIVVYNSIDHDKDYNLAVDR